MNEANILLTYNRTVEVWRKLLGDSTALRAYCHAAATS
jgi:hypothetical protein